MKDYEIILQEATKGMGFIPNSLHAMGKKPNILGALRSSYGFERLNCTCSE